jgi:hypothetical protein
VADGGLLEGLDADWVETARAEHVVDLAGCLAALARRAEAAGDLDGALGWTRRRLALEPLPRRRTAT